jgi:hypothetical protein
MCLEMLAIPCERQKLPLGDGGGGGVKLPLGESQLTDQEALPETASWREAAARRRFSHH